MRWGQVLSVLVSLSLVGVVTVWESQQRVSPGTLHPAHAGVIELSGDAGCDQCHGNGEWAASASTDARACGHCHEAIERQLEARSGLHGSLELAQASDCGRCHPDHHGEDSPLVTVASFALAGVPVRDAYRHEHIENYTLEGRHLEITCVECHLHADDVEVPRGGGRYLGLSTTCTTCHEDRHEGAFGTDCASCHGMESSFSLAPGFQHEAFALAGAHMQAECAQCHPEGTEYSVDREREQAQATRACEHCHESPHQAVFLAQAVGEGGGRPGEGEPGDCAGCHSSVRHDFKGAVLRAEDHGFTGFPLTAPHDQAKCEQCHGDPQRAWPERFPGRGRDDCRSCHEDIHAGQFAPDRYAQCTSCHSRAHFTPPLFDIAAHARTDFPLVGLHEAVSCVACHRTVVAGVRRFDGLETTCSSCHEDVHAGAFDGRSTPVAVGGRRACGRCHDTTGFDTRAPWFDHAWTGYPLEDAHARVDCMKCHPRSSVPDKNGRYFRPARGRDCALCHDDVHMGQFAVEGAIDCRRCHSTKGFEHSNFDHQRDSRFPLDNQHEDLACDKCHKSVPTERGPVVRYRPLGRECGDCHVLGSGGEVRR